MMVGFEWIEKINKIIRWILIVPVLLITYTIIYLIGYLLLSIWIGNEYDSVSNFIMFHFEISFICFFFAIYISVRFAPQWKIVVSSVYLALLLIMLGAAIYSLINTGTYDGRPIWKMLYDIVLNVSAGVSVLIVTILESKDKTITNEGTHSM